MAVTSTGAPGALAGVGAAAGDGAGCVGDAVGAAAPGVAAAADDDERPKMADMMFPKMLIAVPPLSKNRATFREYVLLRKPRQDGEDYTTGERPPSTLTAQPVT